MQHRTPTMLFVLTYQPSYCVCVTGALEVGMLYVHPYHNRLLSMSIPVASTNEAKKEHLHFVGADRGARRAANWWNSAWRVLTAQPDGVVDRPGPSAELGFTITLPPICHSRLYMHAYVCVCTPPARPRSVFGRVYYQLRDGRTV